MVVIVTDVNFKMALSIIRDLGEQGITVVACQSKGDEKQTFDKPLGFYSKHVSRTEWLANMDTSEKQYIDDLHKLCEEVSRQANEPCVLIPVGAKTLQLLTEEENQKKFSNVGLCIPTQNQIDIFNSKKEVAELAEKLGIPVPKSYEYNEKDNLDQFLNNVELPCVIKPNCGEKLNLKAAERYSIAKDRKTLIDKFNYFYKLEKQAPIVQEYVSGDGLGISVLAQEGKIIDSICHRRIREYPSAGGPSTCCITQNIDILEEYAKKMIKSVNYTGIAMLEFKQMEDGSFKILEINPRIWGSYPLTRVAKTKFTYNWFVLANNSVNPKKLPIEMGSKTKANIKMKYIFADLRAIISYYKNKQFAKATPGLLDLINPWVSDGVIEFKDFKASMYYIKSLFSR